MAIMNCRIERLKSAGGVTCTTDAAPVLKEWVNMHGGPYMMTCWDSVSRRELLVFADRPLWTKPTSSLWLSVICGACSICVYGSYNYFYLLSISNIRHDQSPAVCLSLARAIS